MVESHPKPTILNALDPGMLNPGAVNPASVF
jgi:hypothetical protein